VEDGLTKENLPRMTSDESVDSLPLTLTLSSSLLSVSESPRNTEKRRFMMKHSCELTEKFKQMKYMWREHIPIGILSKSLGFKLLISPVQLNYFNYNNKQ
jgi:hypothetical protein